MAQFANNNHRHGGRTHTRVLLRFLLCSMVYGLSLEINHPQIDGEGYISRMRGGQWRDLSSQHGNFLNLRFLNLRPRVETIASCRLATAILTALAASLPACCCYVAILLASLDLQSQNGGSSVPLKGLVINARSMKSQHKVGKFWKRFNNNK